MAKSRLSASAFRNIPFVAASILGVAANYVPRQASPTGSPIISFVNDDELEPSTCQALDVYWLYSGPRGTINLYATNVGLSQATPAPSRTHLADPLPSGVVDTSNITVTIGTNIDPSIFGFRWSSVNIPQGWYILNASVPSQRYSAESVPFFVHTGNDTSCIANFLTPTSSSNSPKPTSSLVLASPVAAASRPETITIGTIIGASFGLAIIVAALIWAYIWFKRSRRKRNEKGEYPNVTHHWKELGSSDSRNALRGDQPYHQSPNNSFGTVLHSAQSDEGAGADKSSIHSKLESTTLSCDQDVALATLPVLKHQSSRSRTFAIDRPPSISSLTTSGPSNCGHSPTPERRSSVRDTKSNRRSLDSVSYPPIRSPVTNPNQPNRASMQLPNTNSRSSLPLGSVEAMKQANRQSLGRKRKPVPVYDGEEPSSPSVPPPLPVSPSSSPLEAFLSASPASSSIGHYVTRNHTIQESGHPDLNPKASFGPGDRPVHYLIPDMPMSQH